MIPLILASCSSKQNQAHLFVYDTKDAFLNEMTENLASRMEEKGVELKIHDAERKQSTQNSDVMETLPVSTGPLFLNLVDRLSASTGSLSSTVYLTESGTIAGADDTPTAVQARDFGGK